MSNYFLFDNSKSRKNLNESTTRTIRFKELFQNFQQFKSSIGVYVNTNSYPITESDFTMLSAMIGNSWLRYKTSNKNIAYIGFKWEEFYAQRLRDQKIYDLDPLSTLKSLSENEQRFFTINQTQLNGQVSDDYLDNSNKNTGSVSIPLIDRFEQIAKLNKMKVPKLMFLTRLAYAIVYPLQNNYTNKNTLGGI